LWYPNLPLVARKKILRFAARVINAREFNPESTGEYLK